MPNPTLAAPFPSRLLPQPLFDAAHAGDLAALEDALARGADPGAFDPRLPGAGVTALMHSAREGRAGCARALLPLCDPNAQDSAGHSALMLAAGGGHLACVELLLPAADMLARDGGGRSPLMLAANGGWADCAAALLPLSLPLELDAKGMSALMHACVDKADASCARLLLDCSEIRARDANGLCAFEIAARTGSAACAELLLPLCGLDPAQLRAAAAVGRSYGHGELAESIAAWALALCERSELEDAVRAAEARSLPARI